MTRLGARTTRWEGDPVQYITIQNGTGQCKAIPYSMIQYNAKCNAVKYDTIQYGTAPWVEH